MFMTPSERIEQMAKRRRQQEHIRAYYLRRVALAEAELKAARAKFAEAVAKVRSAP